jgi:predicted flap endonuclease-1-like 5' DNA nuclease
MTNLKYVGDGAWIPGVPARDLTAEEAQRYAERIAVYPPGLYAGFVPTAKLTDIKGIGERTEEALNDAGIRTLKQLIDADPAALDLALDGSNEKQIRTWQAQARHLLEEN